MAAVPGDLLRSIRKENVKYKALRLDFTGICGLPDLSGSPRPDGLSVRKLLTEGVREGEEKRRRERGKYYLLFSIVGS